MSVAYRKHIFENKVEWVWWLVACMGSIQQLNMLHKHLSGGSLVGMRLNFQMVAISYEELSHKNTVKWLQCSAHYTS